MRDTIQGSIEIPEEILNLIEGRINPDWLKQVLQYQRAEELGGESILHKEILPEQKVCIISDIHLTDSWDSTVLIESLREFDVIIINGDLFDGTADFGKVKERHENFLTFLKDKGAIWVVGNHDATEAFRRGENGIPNRKFTNEYFPKRAANVLLLSDNENNLVLVMHGDQCMNKVHEDFDTKAGSKHWSTKRTQVAEILGARLGPFRGGIHKRVVAHKEKPMIKWANHSLQNVTVIFGHSHRPYYDVLPGFGKKYKVHAFNPGNGHQYGPSYVVISKGGIKELFLERLIPGRSIFAES